VCGQESHCGQAVIQSWEHEVEQDDRRAQRRGALLRLCRCRGLADHHDVRLGLEQRAQTATDARIAAGNQDAEEVVGHVTLSLSSIARSQAQRADAALLVAASLAMRNWAPRQSRRSAA
jgi:hypothetical protein